MNEQTIQLKKEVKSYYGMTNRLKETHVERQINENGVKLLARGEKTTKEEQTRHTRKYLQNITHCAN